MTKELTVQSEALDGEIASTFGPSCIWCGAKWSDENIQVEAYAGGGCDTCGYGGEPHGTVDIVCHECGKLMYRKEFDNRY